MGRQIWYQFVSRVLTNQLSKKEDNRYFEEGRMKIFLCVLVIGMTIATGCAGPRATSEMETKPGASEPADAARIICEKVTNSCPAGSVIAVCEFTTVEGETSIAGKLLAERVVTRLAGHPEISVVERSRLAQIIDEQKLSLSGLVSGAGVSEVGNLVGASVLVLGTMAELSGSYEINARAVDAENGTVITAISTKEPIEAAEERELDNAMEKEQAILTEWKDEVSRKGEKPSDVFPALEGLKRKDMGFYRRSIHTLWVLRELELREPQLFLLVTDPPGSPELRVLRNKRPMVARRVGVLRRDLAKLLKVAPGLRTVLKARRARIIRASKPAKPGPLPRRIRRRP